MTGPRPTGFHTYKVQPTSSGFQFYVDGVLQTTIAASFQTTVSLKAGLSDFTGTSGQPLQADSVSFKSYSTTRSGTFTSMVFNAGMQATWDTAHWTAKLPPGTGITVQVRAGNTSSPDATWSH